MTTLCIETSTAVCSAAICKDGKPLKQCICHEGGNHAKLLPSFIEDLLAYARQNAMTVDAVALSEGPGSYTGLRIGTSTAKGLCYGLDIPLIPIPTLEVLCEAVKRTGVLIPMIDARRMEVYTSVCDSREERGERLEVRAVVVENEESLITDERFSASGEVYYFGDGAAKCQTVLTMPNWHFIPDIVPEAQYVGVLAEKISHQQLSITNQQLAYYEPYYLKEFIAAQSHVKGLQ